MPTGHGGHREPGVESPDLHTDEPSRGSDELANLAPALSSWERDPTLATALRSAEGSYLVLDGSDGRVRHASASAALLVDVLRSLDGGMLVRQLAASCPSEDGHRLVRVRLDSRRIAPPSLFTIARGKDAGGLPVFLLVPSGALSLPRAFSVTAAKPPQAITKPPHAPVEPPAPPALPAAEPTTDLLTEGDRFLWRSDEHGVLTRITGPLGEADAGILGRDWRGLVAGEAASSPHAITAALAGRQTFRRLPVSIRFGRRIVHAELSGAPTGREASEFRGFEGFGVIRSLVDTGAVSAGAIAAVDDGAPGAAEAEPPVDSTLSNDEHAAFREIARALGARYAGDDETSTGGRPIPDRIAGSVMPFPGLRPDLSAGVPKGAEEGGGLLDSLPMAALVHRGETILAANRPFLDLVRYPDVEALRGAGLGAIFPGGAPNFRSGQSHETAIATAEGGARPVEATRGICAWDGGPAAILLLRCLDEDDPRRELAAERLAREVQAGRALGAEAALDALQAAVVTIDGEGRVVTLNRAAAACFGASPSEIVGTRFTSLFDSGSAAALNEALSGGETPGAVLAQGRALTLALAPPRADGHRVAVLHRLSDSPAPVPSGGSAPAPQRQHTLARLDRELREPVSAILALTNAMLEERFGALGDQRYRACLTDIRDAGKRIVERVAELSDLAAVEAGQIDLDPRPLALNELVASCVAVLQTEAARGRIVLRTSFSADLAELEADEASVRRAASLVIEHAIRRSVAGGQVIVSTGTGEAAEVALRVRDGSPAQDTPEAGAADEDLGLALPRALVQANGGRLRLAGRGDEGTLVEILLPARRGARG